MYYNIEVKVPKAVHINKCTDVSMEHECVTAADLLYVLSFLPDARDGTQLLIEIIHYTLRVVEKTVNGDLWES